MAAPTTREEGRTATPLARRSHAQKDVYYPICALTRDHYPVWFPLPGLRLKSGEQMQGAEVVGIRKTYRKNQPSENVVYRVRRADLSYEDLPKFMTPTLFRPLNLVRYPDPLPLPATLAGDVPWGSEHPPITPPDDPLPLDWPRPYAFAPDISREEIEVRVLRGLKTERARGVDDQGLRGPAWKTGSDVLAAMQGGGAITVQAWQPDRRDIGDWPRVREWLRRIDDLARQVIELKSQDYSFRQIGERMRIPRSREWAREKYGSGIDMVWRVANTV